MKAEDGGASPGHPQLSSILVPGVAMCLGWGLRGQFGGPRGAMVPGALVALALALTSRRRPGAAHVWTIAAAGAMGFGIGGEQTYGQTIGLTRNDLLDAPYWNSRVAWGYLGLLLKGAVWGGLGGLFIGAALGGRRYPAGQLLLALNLALALSFLGFWLINEPKLVYFSDPASAQPRREAWAGLWTAWLVLLLLAARAGDRAAVRLSLFGALGGGLGFAAGQFAHAMGARHLAAATGAYVDWWKVMECGFGLLTGLALGWGAAGIRPSGSDDAPAPLVPKALPFAVLALDLLLFFYVADAMDGFGGWIGKAPFLFLAPALLLLAGRVPGLALLLGAAMPVGVTLLNAQQYWTVEKGLAGVAVSVAALAVLTALAAEAARRAAHRPERLFLLVMWGCLACAWLKMLLPAPASWGQPLVTQGFFTLLAAWLTWWAHNRGIRTG